MTNSFQYSTRLNSFRARPDLYAWQAGPKSVADLLRRADGVERLNSVELNYPEHFAGASPEELLAVLAGTHLSVSGINLRYDAPRFIDGGFTNPDAAHRQEAVQVTKEAIDVCRAMGGSHVVVWPAYDGFDYPFEVDYGQTWDWELEALQAVAGYARGLRVSIEYKPCDPRRFSLLGTIGTTLLAIEQSGADLGVTLDFSHMLMAGEHPAFAAALCIRQGRLYGIHLNDGYGQLDDGLLVGSVHLPQTLELLDSLLAAHYDGVIYFDTFPQRENPVEECAANILRVEEMVAGLRRVDRARLEQLLGRQEGMRANQLVWEALFTR